jgi:hypothetical protein
MEMGGISMKLKIDDDVMLEVLEYIDDECIPTYKKSGCPNGGLHCYDCWLDYLKEKLKSND